MIPAIAASRDVLPPTPELLQSLYRWHNANACLEADRYLTLGHYGHGTAW